MQHLSNTFMSAKPIMIQGTGSGVGKSFICAGLCRIFSDMGLRVTPFKAQNMALNSFVTLEGGEIGRAQAFQAEAARVEPVNDINPVLLKTQSDAGCQVILNGRVHSSMTAREYYAFREDAWNIVKNAYDRLSKKFDVIVLEGAGSPAEINLAKEEIVNMNMARYVNSPVLLVGDIDKGGVFASLFGTIELLNGKGSELIKAFVINKFRGDKSILDPGLDIIHEKTGRPVIGVLPHLGDMGMHEEDGIPANRMHWTGTHDSVRIAVVRLSSISNFTDFDPFMYESDVDIHYSLRKNDLEQADLIILPGTKNTVKDLLKLKETGIDVVITDCAKRGIPIIGICGGYQMLGQKILDPDCIESQHPEIEGLGLLDTVTIIEREKITRQVTADILTPPPGIKNAINSIQGYEIHQGRTTPSKPLFNLHPSGAEDVPDGTTKNMVWGTYLHGIFDNDAFRRELINSLIKSKGLKPLGKTISYEAKKDEAINRWADVLREHINMKFIFDAIGVK